MQRSERPLVGGIDAGVKPDEQSGYVYVLEDQHKTSNESKVKAHNRRVEGSS